MLCHASYLGGAVWRRVFFVKGLMEMSQIANFSSTVMPSY